MTLWIRIDANIGDNPNVWKLAALRGVSAVACVGHLVMLFGNVAEYRPHGDVADVPDNLLERWAGWEGTAGLFAVSFRELFVTDGVIEGWAERQGKLVERAEKEKDRWHRRKQRGDSTEESAARNGTVRNEVKASATTNGKHPRLPRVAAPAPPEVAAVLEYYRTRHPKRRPGPKEEKLIAKALGWGFAGLELCEAIDGNAEDPWHAERGKHDLAYLFRDAGHIDNARALFQAGNRLAVDPETGAPNELGLAVMLGGRR